MESTFKHYNLELVFPEFTSPLLDLILELDHLRRKQLQPSPYLQVFFQLKRIFHTLESIGSARIEGNNTTIVEYIETKLAEAPPPKDGILEIVNMEQTMSFIDENIKDTDFNRAFVSELHKKVVTGLRPPPNGEGDHTPGVYRKNTVSINRSAHKPPEPLHIETYMDELFAFINHSDEPKYDLLKIAIAHHRFLWIHPFTNGNGRTVRLFTYAMLVKQGFNVDIGRRILNPTAVFCSDRKKYYDYLSVADSGKKEDVLNWCEYVLSGLKEEIEKIDRLLDYDYLKKEILLPAISYSQERKFITDTEARVMKKAIEKPTIQASDLKDIFVGKYASVRSVKINKLIEKKMLMPVKEGARKYVIRFDNNFLIRGVIKLLSDKGFIPIKDEI